MDGCHIDILVVARAKNKISTVRLENGKTIFSPRFLEENKAKAWGLKFNTNNVRFLLGT